MNCDAKIRRKYRGKKENRLGSFREFFTMENSLKPKIMDDSYLLVNWRKVERMAYLGNHGTFLYVV